MKINIELEVKPFGTPNYVRTSVVGEEETVNDTAIHVRDIDTATLHDLCDEFKRNVFKQAGKEMEI